MDSLSPAIAANVQELPARRSCAVLSVASSASESGNFIVRRRLINTRYLGLPSDCIYRVNRKQPTGRWHAREEANGYQGHGDLEGYHHAASLKYH